MSKLSEEIEKAYQGIRDDEGVTDSAIRLIGNGDSLTENTPGFPGFKQHYEHCVHKIIRKMYRFHAGSELCTPKEMMERHRGELLVRLSPLVLSAFSDGILIAQDQILPVKKAFYNKEIDSVFDSKVFRTESDLFVFSLEADQDVVEMVHRIILNTVTGIGEGSGLFRAGKEMHYKIWDLWCIAVMSSLFTFYMLGNRLGKKWTENDTLAGIMNATESQDD